MKSSNSDAKTSLLKLNIAVCALLAALLTYPFSIAGSNLFFGIAIIATLFHFSVLKHGYNVCWQQYKTLTIGILLFIAFNFIGSMWGGLTDTALHKMAKQMNWIVIPMIIGLIYYKPKLYQQAFIAISIGLFLHLILCTLQYNGFIHLSGQGSAKHDATGLVGHLSFGFIYGIWSGALIIAAQKLKPTWKYICYLLAAYSVVTVFMAQGRSGYITTITCLILVIFKALHPEKWKLKLFTTSILFLVLTSFVFLHSPTRAKVERTISGVTSFLNGDWHHVDERIKIWAVGVEIYKENPYFGVGTGGYPDAIQTILKSEKLAYLHIRPNELEAFYGHPHNEYLLELARWGPLGLLVLLYLCWQWLSIGWRKNWQTDTLNAYLFTASALSIILHGFTEPSLNKHIETVFAFIVLALAMSQTKLKHNK